LFRNDMDRKKWNTRGGQQGPVKVRSKEEKKVNNKNF